MTYYDYCTGSNFIKNLQLTMDVLRELVSN